MATSEPSVSMLKYALPALVAVVGLNIFVRSTFKFDPVAITLFIAISVAGLVATWFGKSVGRVPTATERTRFLWVYGGLLALVFVAMAMADPARHGATGWGYGLLLLHYLPYPAFAQLFLSERYLGKRIKARRR